MKKDLTELVFVIDRSGSMFSLIGDTIGGFNSMLDKQKEQEGSVLVSTVLFDDESQVLHDRIPLERVEYLTEKDYTVRGCTALLDALGDAVIHISNVHKYARSEDVPEHTLFVIITDGMENASHRHTAESVRRLLKEKEEKYGWEFLFMAANIDAVKTASQYGIKPERAVNYHADGQGTKKVYNAVSDAICAARASVPLEKCEWRKSADEDFQSRKK